jgi:nitrogen fixation-related uncharacterized protein
VITLELIAKVLITASIIAVALIVLAILQAMKSDMKDDISTHGILTAIQIVIILAGCGVVLMMISDW